MEIIIGLLLLVGFVLWIMSFFVEDRRLVQVVLGCLLVAVALLAFGARIVT